MNQEPGNNATIKSFARELYGAEFLLFEKTDVNGPKTCEVFKFLRQNSSLYDTRKKQSKEIPWNFAKFLLNGEGKVISYHDPRVLPNELEKDIEKIIN
jgi:glutathione peroxidase